MGSLHGPAPGPQRNPSLLPLREGVDGVQDSERGRNRDLKESPDTGTRTPHRARAVSELL
uniref:Uncharacterized protein n=1 Tax=Chlorocebus sabaeus TaxID=60711 RepID=A0A0D9S5U3_CHLSB